MYAYRIHAFGSPDALQRDELPRPEPGPGQVLIRVHATSVNPVDTKIRRQGGSYGLEPPITLGYDVSGTVEAAGEGVEGIAPGDAVFYTPALNPHGAYAEYHVADADIVVPKPEALSHPEAAALPLAGCTAWQALLDRAALRVGETVLIHGSGGVGALAVQIAAAAGARVLVVGSPPMEQTITDLGADVFVSYKAGTFEGVVQEATNGAGVDVVLDTVGEETLAKSIGVLVPFGRMVTIVGTARGELGPVYRKNGTVHFVMMQRERATMEALRTLVLRGQLRPVIDSVRPLAEVAEAHRRIESGGVRGKIVLRVD